MMIDVRIVKVSGSIRLVVQSGFIGRLFEVHFSSSWSNIDLPYRPLFCRPLLALFFVGGVNQDRRYLNLRYFLRVSK